MNSVHTKEWARNIHKPQAWYCDLTHTDGKPLRRFSTSAELEDHFDREHEHLNCEEMISRINRNFLTVSRPSDVCPLCNEVIPDLVSHLGNKTTIDAPKQRQVSFAVAESSKDILSKSPSQPPVYDGQYSSSSPTHLKSKDIDEMAGFDLEEPQIGKAQQKDDRNKRMSQHVARHLKSLAFISLQWFDRDCFSTDSGTSSRRSSIETTPNAREIQDSDEEFDVPLSEVIRKRLVKSEFDSTDRWFMPEGVLERCITRGRILAALDIDDPDQDDERLLSFIQQSAMKIFATCVLVKLEKTSQLRTAMQHFLNNEMDDSILPVKNAFRNRVFTAANMQPVHFFETTESHSKQGKRVWDIMTIDAFYHHQWKFLVPVFSTEGEAGPYSLDLDEDTILPFTAKHDIRVEGLLSKIYRCEIHPNHIHGPALPVRYD